MEGFQRFRKGSANTSAVVFAFDLGVFFHLKTDHGVRSTGAPVLWNANRIECICILLSLITP